MNLRQGTLLKHGEYRIERELGHGGFGITYLATQVGLNRKVAIKEFFMSEYCERDADTSQVSLGTSGSRDTVERFKKKFVKEAQNIACLKHPHIISIHDVFEDNGTAYYVMEYLEYGSLADLVKRQGRLSEADALRYTRQIADALRYIHARKMNHLDVKPGNILIDEADHAVLIDFGLSKRYDDEGNQTSTTPVGISHGYAPLEQYKKSGVGTFSPAMDIYSLGATLYKLVTGTTPPDANDVSEDGLPALPSYVSSTVASAIEQAMQPRRKDRPQSVDAFLDLLDAKGNEATVIGINDNDTTIINEPAGKNDSWKRITVISILLLLTIGGINWWGDYQAEQAEQQRLAAIEQVRKDSIAKVRAAEEAEQQRLAAIEAEKQRKYAQTHGVINGYEWVDLGLSVKWATCNVGATSPEHLGNYYAWGETKPKSDYTDLNSVAWRRYIGDIAGNAQYDAARANWGGSWRMPTKTECEELIRNCTWERAEQGGMNGYKVISKKNGNSIFVIFTGYYDYSQSILPGTVALWSSTQGNDNNDNNERAYHLDAGIRSPDVVSSNFLYEGRMVRPVTN